MENTEGSNKPAESRIKIHSTKETSFQRREEMPFDRAIEALGQIKTTSTPLFIEDKVFTAIERYLHGSEKERAGLLFGHSCIDAQGKKFVKITEFIQKKDDDGTYTQVTISQDEYTVAYNQADAKKLELVGWVHSHPSMFTAPSSLDVQAMQRFFNKDHLPTIIIDPFDKKIGRFSIDPQTNQVRNDGGFYLMGDDHEKNLQNQYRFTTAVSLNEPRKEHRLFTPDFNRFTDEYLKKEGYAECVRRYNIEFQWLISQHQLLEPIRQYIPAMIEKGTQAVKKIKAHFFSQRTHVAPEALKKIFTEQWIKRFVNAPRFPIQGTDRETDYWKKQLEIAFVALFSIENMNHEALLSQEEKEIVDLYNKGMHNAESKNKFMNTFNPTRIATINYMERRRNVGISPVFKSATDGDWLGIKSKDQYYIVPRYDMTYQESYHGPVAGMNFFDYEDEFDSRKKYKNYTVIKPAIMEQESNHEFKIIKKGLLRLGEGEMVSYQ